MSDQSPKGQMSVRQAGARGGAVTASRYGSDFYQEIGRRGGQKVRALMAQGRAAEAREKETTE